MKPDHATFLRLISARSEENMKSFQLLHVSKLYGNCISTIRQELDSYVRVLFLLSVSNSTRRNLIGLTTSGKQWSLAKPNGKKQKITDALMVDQASTMHGWTKNVYLFGCAFIHLSNFHDYHTTDPATNLDHAEHAAITEYIQYYHGMTLPEDFTISDLFPVLPNIMSKLNSNFKHALSDLAKALA